MMDKDTAAKFNDSYGWFTAFYRDLHELLRTISNQLAKMPQPYTISSAVPLKSFMQLPNNGSLKLPNPIVVSHVHGGDAEHGGKAHLPVVSVLSVLSLDEELDPSEAQQIRIAAPLTVLRHESVKPYSLEPSLVIFLHEDYGRKTSPKCTLKGEPVGEGESFKGTLAVGADGKEVRFSCFLVPLDAFSDEKCPNKEALNAVIGDKVINPLKKRLDEFGEAKQ